ncbi:hypothetical protein KI387_010841, partial [Taxus chinensis]
MGVVTLVKPKLSYLGSKQAIECGISHLHIEGDSQIIVQEKKALNWALDVYASNILFCLRKLDFWSIGHVYKEANMAVNLLANVRVMQVDETIISNDVSRWSGLKDIISKDVEFNHAP